MYFWWTDPFLLHGYLFFQLDFEVPFGSKGKTPWITLNGEHYTDSQLIIELLTKYDHHKVIWPNQTYIYLTAIIVESLKYALELLIQKKKRRLRSQWELWWMNIFTGTNYDFLKTNFFVTTCICHRAVSLWRYVHSGGKGFSEIASLPPSAIPQFLRAAYKRASTNAWAQGIGRHDKDTVVAIMKKDLEIVSTLLGKKKFILGDEPCEEDCAIFGFLAQALWCLPGSPYEKCLTGMDILNAISLCLFLWWKWRFSFLEELPNLKAYCVRMKEQYWTDWDEILAKWKAFTINSISLEHWSIMK